MKRSADWSSVSWVLILCFAASIVYGSSLRLYFSQDDFVFLARASRVASLADFFQLFTASDHFYRPLPRVGLFVAQLRLFGLNAGAFHLVSLGAHCTNAVLLFLLCRILFGSTLLAGLSGFLYATHPISFLAVYWISGAQDLSATTLLLLSLLLYCRFIRVRKGLYFAGSLMAFGLALLSKETAATLPGLVLLVALALRGRGTLAPRLRELPTHALSYGLVLGLYLAVRWHKTPAFIPTDGPYAWILDPQRVLGRILDYFHDAFYLRTWLATNSVAANLVLALFAAVLVLLVWHSRHHRWMVALGLGWFVLSLLPVLFVAQPTYGYYAYFPFAGMAMVLAALLWVLLKRIAASGSGPAYAQNLVRGGATALLLVAGLWFSHRQVLATESQDPAGIIDKSLIAQEAITQVRELYPSLPAGSTLYVEGADYRDAWAMGQGSLFRLYYPEVNVVMVPLGEESRASGEDDEGYVYVFDGGQ